MRILYAITRSELSPAQVHLLDLVRGFRRHCDIHIATGDEGYLTEMARGMGVECHVVPDLARTANPLRAAGAYRRMTELIATLHPDLVHAHTASAGVVARMAARASGIPAIYTAHDWTFDHHSSRWQHLRVPLEWLASRQCARLVTVSDECRHSALRRGLDHQRLVTIRPGFADAPWRARPARTAIPEIVMVAPFIKRSQHRFVMEAFAGMDAPALLTFIGDGDNLSWMRGLSFKLGIGGKVRFLGDCSDVPHLLAQAHILAYAGPSRRGIPATVIDGLRAGLPVVATGVGTIHEAVTNGENGYLVPPNDVTGFRNAIWALAADPELRARMGQAARLRFEQNFSIDQMLAKTEALYNRVWTEAYDDAGSEGGAHRRATTAAGR